MLRVDYAFDVLVCELVDSACDGARLTGTYCRSRTGVALNRIDVSVIYPFNYAYMPVSAANEANGAAVNRLGLPLDENSDKIGEVLCRSQKDSSQRLL